MPVVMLHYRQYGDPADVPVMLLHGLFGSSANWGSVARQLASRGFHVIVPDLRNHGQSPHDAEHNYPAMAVDLEALLDQLGVEKAVVVGHSMGGKAAMELALTSAHRVAGLVVVDIAPVAYAHDFDAVLQAFNAVDLARIGDRSDAQRQMAPHVATEGLQAFLLQNLTKEGGSWRWRLNLAALAENSQAITGFPDLPPGQRYLGKTLFVHGAESDYLEAAHHARTRALFPSARLVEIPAAGHWVYADQPAAFVEALLAFLAGTEAQSLVP